MAIAVWETTSGHGGLEHQEFTHPLHSTKQSKGPLLAIAALFGALAEILLQFTSMPWDR